MGGELGGVRFRDGQDQSMGEKLMEVALGLMREVKEDLREVKVDLKEVIEQRRSEAREAGEISSRLSTLETAMPRDARTRLETLEQSHGRVRGVAYGLAVLALAGLMIWLLKIAILHPDALPK